LALPGAGEYPEERPHYSRPRPTGLQAEANRRRLPKQENRQRIFTLSVLARTFRPLS